MATPLHHVIIGSGSAGFGAALALRQNDKDCRVSMMTMDSLPFYNRYDLPRIFRGQTDWHELLAQPPEFYADNRITLRRHNKVVDVDGQSREIRLAHQETVRFDSLLVCAGGRGFQPEALIDHASLMHGFGSYEAAMRLYRDLPKNGHVAMIGGDMIGIDLALTMIDTGYRVSLIATSQTFWPHEPDQDTREALLAALADRGITIIAGQRPTSVTATSDGAREIGFESGTSLTADVVIPACGLVPMVEFMLNAGVDIERGLLVTPELGTTHPNIWAAGDVCQIWNDTEKEYKFYHGWKNVRTMGELAARNITGAHEIFDVKVTDRIALDAEGNIQSTFWTH